MCHVLFYISGWKVLMVKRVSDLFGLAMSPRWPSLWRRAQPPVVERGASAGLQEAARWHGGLGVQLSVVVL